MRTDDRNDNKPLLKAESEQVSYAYSYDGSPGNRTWTEAAPSQTRILADGHVSESLKANSNHKLDGRNVAFADRHVRWISGTAKLLTNPDHPDPKINTQSWRRAPR